MSNTGSIHKFEDAGLGRAPYRFLGCESKVGPIIVRNSDGTETHIGAPGQPMSACDYCGTGIAEEFWFQSADGKRFKVGCDCFYKAEGKRSMLASAVKRADNARKREASRARDDARIDRLRAYLETHAEVLSAQPHPKGFVDRQTGRALTMLDQANWTLQHAGRAGCVALARKLGVK